MASNRAWDAWAAGFCAHSGSRKPPFLLPGRSWIRDLAGVRRSADPGGVSYPARD